MKYAFAVSLIITFGAVAGCGDEPSSGATSGGNAGNGGSAGEGGTGGTSSSSSSSSSGVMVCDNSDIVDKVDPAMRCKSGMEAMDVVNIVMAPANTIWADKVDSFSTEFGPENYGAKQALGAPNVYPASGDKPQAWAQSMLDEPNEFIKVGFSTPVVAESVWVFETFNPGAISKITVTAADGDHVVHEAMPMMGGFGPCAHVLSVSTKTCSPISAVRIDVASDKVSTYNEIDAVGLIPAQ